MKLTIAAIFISWLALFATQARCDDSVLLTLKANRYSIKEGEELQLSFAITNGSKNQYRFSLLNNALAGPWVITDEHGKSCRWLHTVEREIRCFPRKNDLYLLKPGEGKEFTFTFILEEGSKSFIRTRNNKEVFAGYFLFAQKWKSYIYLANSKTAIIQARYRSSDGDKAAVKEYGFTELYEGDLVSEPITINIEEN